MVLKRKYRITKIKTYIIWSKSAFTDVHLPEIFLVSLSKVEIADEIITIMLCVNSDGSYKMIQTVIESCLNPLCLKGFRKDLFVEYKANKKFG
jgi:hypothetical protein